jgi:hypothetical protein
MIFLQSQAGPDEAVLIPECRLVSSFLWIEGVSLKAGSDAVVAYLAHLKFLSLGALGVGVLFVSAHGFTPERAQRPTTQSLHVDDDRATIPVMVSRKIAISSQPSPAGSAQLPSSETAPVRSSFLRPLPPPKVCVNGQCSPP